MSVPPADDNITSRQSDFRDYVRAVFDAGAWGWVCAAFGVNPRLRDNGKIRHQDWFEGAFAWPGNADAMPGELAKAAPLIDVYLCPYVMRGGSRAKGTSVARPLVHCDGDDGLDLAQAQAIPGVFVVGSGTARHGHVYVRLTRSVEPHHHEQLCKGLADYLGAVDPKHSDNDVLRPPGTLNRKPTVRGGEPVPVVWLIRPDGQRINPEELARLLGVELTDQPPLKPKAKPKSKTGGAAGAAFTDETEPFDLFAYRRVRAALAKVTGDRSKDTNRVVGACVDSGLTEANARWAVHQREDLAERLDGRRDDDIGRCWERVTDSREHENVAKESGA